MLSKVKEKPPSERPESSTLFSLQELRRMEDDRVEKEAQAARARVEAERRAREEAERRDREEAAERVRAEEERVRRVEEERLARVREDQLRLEEAERRARVEGELKLKEQRLHLEMQQQRGEPRRGWRSPLVLVGGVAVILLGVGGVTAARINDRHRAEKETMERELAEQHRLALAAQADYEQQIRDLREDTKRRLLEAKTAKDRALILEEEKRKQQELKARPRRPGPHGPTPGTTDPAKPNRPRVDKRVIDPNNPLEGLTGGGL